MRDRMPESGSPSAADCWRLEARPGAVSAHAWPAFTPVPWHWLLAPASEDIARVSLQLGAARLRSLPQALFQEAQPAAPSGGVSSQPQRERWWPPAGCAPLCRQHSKQLPKCPAHGHGHPASPLPSIIYWSGLMLGDGN